MKRIIITLIAIFFLNLSVYTSILANSASSAFDFEHNIKTFSAKKTHIKPAVLKLALKAFYNAKNQ